MKITKNHLSAICFILCCLAYTGSAEAAPYDCDENGLSAGDECPDNNANDCTFGICVGDGAAVTCDTGQPRDVGTACDDMDGNECTVGSCQDIEDARICVGAALAERSPCMDSTPADCTIALCLNRPEQVGEVLVMRITCVQNADNVTDGVDCDDDDPGTTGETCSGGVCEVGGGGAGPACGNGLQEGDEECDAGGDAQVLTICGADCRWVLGAPEGAGGACSLPPGVVVGAVTHVSGAIGNPNYDRDSDGIIECAASQRTIDYCTARGIPFCDTSVCGNDRCDGDESRITCPADCTCIVNGACDGDETTENCPDDCHCGDEVVQADRGEECDSGGEEIETCTDTCLWRLGSLGDVPDACGLPDGSGARGHPSYDPDRDGRLNCDAGDRVSDHCDGDVCDLVNDPCGNGACGCGDENIADADCREVFVEDGPDDGEDPDVARVCGMRCPADCGALPSENGNGTVETVLACAAVGDQVGPVLSLGEAVARANERAGVTDCGNGILEAGEACEDGNQGRCNDTCTDLSESARGEGQPEGEVLPEELAEYSGSLNGVSVCAGHAWGGACPDTDGDPRTAAGCNRHNISTIFPNVINLFCWQNFYSMECNDTDGDACEGEAGLIVVENAVDGVVTFNPECRQDLNPNPACPIGGGGEEERPVCENQVCELALGETWATCDDDCNICTQNPENDPDGDQLSDAVILSVEEVVDTDGVVERRVRLLEAASRRELGIAIAQLVNLVNADVGEGGEVATVANAGFLSDSFRSLVQPWIPPVGEFPPDASQLAMILAGHVRDGRTLVSVSPCDDDPNVARCVPTGEVEICADGIDNNCMGGVDEEGCQAADGGEGGGGGGGGGDEDEGGAGGGDQGQGGGQGEGGGGGVAEGGAGAGGGGGQGAGQEGGVAGPAIGPMGGEAPIVQAPIDAPAGGEGQPAPERPFEPAPPVAQPAPPVILPPPDQGAGGAEPECTSADPMAPACLISGALNVTDCREQDGVWVRPGGVTIPANVAAEMFKLGHGVIQLPDGNVCTFSLQPGGSIAYQCQGRCVRRAALGDTKPKKSGGLFGNCSLSPTAGGNASPIALIALLMIGFGLVRRLRKGEVS